MDADQRGNHSFGIAECSQLAELSLANWDGKEQVQPECEDQASSKHDNPPPFDSNDQAEQEEQRRQPSNSRASTPSDYSTDSQYPSMCSTPDFVSRCSTPSVLYLDDGSMATVGTFYGIEQHDHTDDRAEGEDYSQSHLGQYARRMASEFDDDSPRSYGDTLAPTTVITFLSKTNEANEGQQNSYDEYGQSGDSVWDQYKAARRQGWAN